MLELVAAWLLNSVILAVCTVIGFVALAMMLGILLVGPTLYVFEKMGWKV